MQWFWVDWLHLDVGNLWVMCCNTSVGSEGRNDKRTLCSTDAKTEYAQRNLYDEFEADLSEEELFEPDYSHIQTRTRRLFYKNHFFALEGP